MNYKGNRTPMKTDETSELVIENHGVGSSILPLGTTSKAFKISHLQKHTPTALLAPIFRLCDECATNSGFQGALPSGPTPKVRLCSVRIHEARSPATHCRRDVTTMEQAA